MVDTESVNPNINAYLAKLESRLNRKARLAHEIGAGAKCTKCGDKCPGFELHYWRKLCMNCRCSKDDHDIQDDDEDIGHIIIGKLFDRPDPLGLSSHTPGEGVSHTGGQTGGHTEGQSGGHAVGQGADKGKGEDDITSKKMSPKRKITTITLELPTGVGDGVGGGGLSGPQQFVWAPPNVSPALAARYMSALPPDRRPIVGSKAAKTRRKQLGQQLPLYDMDETRRCEAMAPPELQQFRAHLQHVRDNVVGQGVVAEVASATKILVGPSSRGGEHICGESHSWNEQGAKVEGSYVGSGTPGMEKIGDRSLFGDTAATNHQKVENNKLSSAEDTYNDADNNANCYQTTNSSSTGATDDQWPAPPPEHWNERNQQFTVADKNLNNANNNAGPRSNFISGMLGNGQQQEHQTGTITTTNRDNFNAADPLTKQMEGLAFKTSDQNYNDPRNPVSKDIPKNMASGVLVGRTSIPGSAYPKSPVGISNSISNIPSLNKGSMSNIGDHPGSNLGLPRPYMSNSANDLDRIKYVGSPQSKELRSSEYEGHGQTTKSLNPFNSKPIPFGTNVSSQYGYSPFKMNAAINSSDPKTGTVMLSGNLNSLSGSKSPRKGSSTDLDSVGVTEGGVSHPVSSVHEAVGLQPGSRGLVGNIARDVRHPILESHQQQGSVEPYRERLAGSNFQANTSDVNVLFPGESAVLYNPVNSSNTLYGAEAMNNSSLDANNYQEVASHNCQQCNKTMVAGEVAVICERAGPDKFWHPGCFMCSECGELLADMIYFWQDGKVYCGRHYYKAASVPRCHACDELIFSSSWTRAEEYDWHLPHFTCFLCDTQLAGHSYVPSTTGHPYCLNCHMTTQAQMCETCEQKVAPGEKQCTYRGYHYHATDACFSCHSCRVAVLGGRFKMCKNWLFCSTECVDSSAEEIQRNANTKFKYGDEET